MTTRFASIAALDDGDVIVEAFTEQVPQSLNYLTVPGATLGVLGGSNTLTIAAEFHPVSIAAGNIDNLADSLGAAAGQQVRLLFANAQTIRHNAGGAGNIRTLSGNSYQALPNEMVMFGFDGTNWWVMSRAAWPLVSYVATAESVGSANTYVDLTTVGPSCVAPITGSYTINFGAWLMPYNNGAQDQLVTPKLGSASPVDANGIYSFSGGASGVEGGNYMKKITGVALTAGDVVKLQYKSFTTGTAGIGNFGMSAGKIKDRWLELVLER